METEGSGHEDARESDKNDKTEEGEPNQAHRNGDPELYANLRSLGTMVLNTYRAYCLVENKNMPYFQFVSLLTDELNSYPNGRSSHNSPHKERIQISREVCAKLQFSYTIS